MSNTDIKYNDLIKNIHEKGTWDRDLPVRPKYEDGEPAYTKSLFGVQIEFPEGELPILTNKKVFWDKSIGEMLLFWVKQTVQEKDFKEDKVGIWNQWFNSDGNLGRSYAYQFESHRHHIREKIQVQPRKNVYKGEVEIDDSKICGVGELGDYKSVKNYKEHEVKKLFYIWTDMLHKCYKGITQTPYEFTVNRWFTFENFLRDIRYVPQFFLAKEDNFKGWELSKEYFNSNSYSPSTTAWIKRKEHFKYKLQNDFYFYIEPRKKTFTRKELSKNQLVNLIYNIKNNPASRRLMTSFWNDADADKKQLQECAWSTNWNVRNGKLELILIQRSVDSGLGLPFNWLQYKVLQRMIAQVTGLKAGKFVHQMANVHYYDRHEQSLLEQTENKKYEEPTLWINSDVKDFFDFTIDDFKMVGYVHGKFQKMEVAI